MSEQANQPQQPNLIDQVKQAVGVSSDAAATAAPETPAAIQFKRVAIIVNPASGQTGLNLLSFNKVLKDLDTEWEMFVMRKGGEAYTWAKQAVENKVDAIAVYGGDGTVLEVASAVAGTDVPIVIIPGGTANVLSVELGIPADQTQAEQLLGAVPNAIRTLDMASLAHGSGEQDLLFFHLGIGLEGAMNEGADREAKDRSGMLAYAVAALKTLANPTVTHYTMTLDGETVEADGINCMVTNFGSVGVGNIKLSHSIDMSDGLLDVIIFQDANLTSVVSAAAKVVTSGELAPPTLLQWQAREVTIKAEPMQPIVVDGELIKIDEVKVSIVPKAVRVVVPAAT